MTGDPDGGGANGGPGSEPIFHVDGDLVPASEAAVNVRDRGFMYGDAAFETLRAYGGEIFEWEAHADRLAGTCRTLGLDHGLDRADLRDRIHATLAANGFRDAYLKLSVSRGVQPGKLDPVPDVEPTVVVYATALPRGGTGGTDVWDGPATLRTVGTQRIPSAAIPASAKTHNYLNGILARRDAPEADEALLLDAGGRVAEGATSNLFFVCGGTLRTPSLDGPILPGVTRRVVLELAREDGVPVEEGRYTPGDVREASEAFLTNTTWELRPVGEFDGVDLGGGPLTGRLRDLFDGRVERTCYRG